MRGTGIEETLFQRLFDKRGRFFPSQIFKHHHSGKDDGTGIHNVFPGNVRSRPVSSLKNGMPRFIVDIRTRCNADAAYHGSQLVGHIIAVQIQRGNHGIFFGDKQRVLQECIGNAVLDDQTPFCQLFTNSRSASS